MELQSFLRELELLAESFGLTEEHWSADGSHLEQEFCAHLHIADASVLLYVFRAIVVRDEITQKLKLAVHANSCDAPPVEICLKLSTPVRIVRQQG